MVYKIIASGSNGNAVLYHESILIDCGVPFSLIQPFLKDLQIVLLTHEHKDHFNRSTLKKIIYERPSVRIGCCNDWFDTLQGRNVDRYEIGEFYDYGLFQVSPVKLYHDIPNCGYRIFKNNYKIFHATDTGHLNGITAIGYDLYALEHNYNEDTVYSSIASHEENGEFDYRSSAIKTHLSEQQAQRFIFENKGENYEVLRLHESKIA